MPDNSSLEYFQDTQTCVRASTRTALLEDLCTRLTAAQQGDRDLDVAIGEVLGEIPNPFDWIPVGGGIYLSLHTGDTFDTADGRCVRRRVLPEWSSSLDAALSALDHLPGDFTYTLTRNDDGSHSAVVGRRAGFVLSNTSWGGSAPTPALAMMIAIVRAMREGAQ
jgi:hypothetical protein